MEHQINEEIRDKEVRLIGDDGEQLGILPIQQAQDIAVEKGMDLVKVRAVDDTGVLDVTFFNQPWLKAREGSAKESACRGDQRDSPDA